MLFLHYLNDVLSKFHSWIARPLIYDWQLYRLSLTAISVSLTFFFPLLYRLYEMTSFDLGHTSICNYKLQYLEKHISYVCVLLSYFLLKTVQLTKTYRRETCMHWYLVCTCICKFLCWIDTLDRFSASFTLGKHFPSRHTTLKQRWFNVDSTPRRWINVVSTLCAR